MANYIDAKNSIDNILSQLKDTHFMKYLSDRNYEEDIENAWYADDTEGLLNFFQYGDYPDNICYAYGASKIVVWDCDWCDYVMKIPRFDSDDHYCLKETEVYDLASSMGVEEAFAWSALIYEPGVFGNRGIYAMEFVSCDEEEIDSSSYHHGFIDYCESEELDPDSSEAQEQYQDYYWQYEDCDELIWDWAATTWKGGISRLVSQIIWKCGINDLHRGNWGFRGNTVVMTDYSGY